ncbi:MAG: InlB B-repeat-containing protein [Verrucomicrobiales bacterium]
MINIERGGATTITSADHNALPVGETITLTGTGFTGTTRASFIWRPFNTSAPFRELSDTSLEVDYAARQSIRVHSLLVEAAAGSTITSDLSESEVDEFEGSGTFTPTRSLVIVKAGAILEGISNALVPELIYVEAGGVLKIRPDMFGGDLKIFAEDGSIIDFRSAGALPPHNASPVVFYSPHTEILGTAPDGFARQLTPISLSLGVGPFTQGFRVNISTEGPGTISGFDESTTYYRRGEEINVEATPTPGNYFIRWTGSISSTANQLNLSANRNLNLVARFSPLADFISTWRAANFTPEQLADISISGLNADPDNDGNSNTTEYIFGGNPLIADTGAKVEVLNIDPIEKTIELSYNRPMFVADVNNIYLGSTDLTTWSNLSETGQVDESSSEELSDLREKVHLKVFFSDHFPENFSFRVSAALE